jgi:hypothetical protein
MGSCGGGCGLARRFRLGLGLSQHLEEILLLTVTLTVCLLDCFDISFNKSI